MFHVIRRILAGMPLASVIIGFAGQPAILLVPPALTTLCVLLRDRLIRREVGRAAWPSDGFARHVLVDDIARVCLLTLLSLPLFAAGWTLRTVLG
jgi:hypothetical protein